MPTETVASWNGSGGFTDNQTYVHDSQLAYGSVMPFVGARVRFQVEFNVHGASKGARKGTLMVLAPNSPTVSAPDRRQRLSEVPRLHSLEQQSQLQLPVVSIPGRSHTQPSSSHLEPYYPPQGTTVITPPPQPGQYPQRTFSPPPPPPPHSTNLDGGFGPTTPPLSPIRAVGRGAPSPANGHHNATTGGGGIGIGTHHHPPDSDTEYLLHCTRDGAMCAKNEPQVARYERMNAFDRLLNILKVNEIFGTSLPHVMNAKAVSLNECPLASVLDHTVKYSPHGVAFKKEFVFQQGGRPAHRTGAEHRTEVNSRTGEPYYEREWRVRDRVLFTLDDVEFVLVYSSGDALHLARRFPYLDGKVLVVETLLLVDRLYPAQSLQRLA